MGLFGFIITVVAGMAGGWWLKGKVDKQPGHKPYDSDDEDL